MHGLCLLQIFDLGNWVLSHRVTRNFSRWRPNQDIKKRMVLSKEHASRCPLSEPPSSVSAMITSPTLNIDILEDAGTLVLRNFCVLGLCSVIWEIMWVHISHSNLGGFSGFHFLFLISVYTMMVIRPRVSDWGRTAVAAAWCGCASGWAE